ncbi:MAG: glycosyltransferase, partial [Bacteroidota bacterium]|nr:glycosyltransferase [Bacteroidota bacterium]
FIRSWGVDVDFFSEYTKGQHLPPSNDYIFSTGGTNRDFNTLIEAFNHLDFKLKITAKEDFTNEIRAKVTPNVEIDTSVVPGLTSVARLRSDYYNSLAVAIPILVEEDHNPSGVTVLFEAAALAKPIITTWNKSYPFDVEKEKIGFNVNYGDSEGWKQAVQYMTDHRDEAREMGERARHLCKTKYNYKLFSQEIIRNIEYLSMK